MTSAGTGLDHEVADAYRELGDRYRDDDAADAEVFYRRSLRFRPDVAGVHARLAAALCKLNRFGEAEDHLSRARSLDPHHDETSCLWADLAVLNGRVPEALQVYRTALLNGASARLRRLAPSGFNGPLERAGRSRQLLEPGLGAPPC